MSIALYGNINGQSYRPPTINLLDSSKSQRNDPVTVSNAFPDTPAATVNISGEGLKALHGSKLPGSADPFETAAQIAYMSEHQPIESYESKFSQMIPSSYEMNERGESVYVHHTNEEISTSVIASEEVTPQIEERIAEEVPLIKKIIPLAKLDITKTLPVLCEKTENFVVEPDETISSLLKRAEITNADAYQITKSLQEVYDLRKIQPGDEVEICSNTDDAGLKQATSIIIEDRKGNRYKTHKLAENEYEAQMIEPTTSTQLEKAYGSITGPFIKNAKEVGIPTNVIQQIISAFDGVIDFNRDIQKNDTFTAVFKKEYNKHNEPTGNGDLLYASFKIRGETHERFKYTDSNDKDDYYDENGKIARELFVMHPLAKPRLTSRFGQRKHPILGYRLMHWGNDYGAPIGTPVRAPGDGVVTLTARRGSYGRLVEIKHNSEYSTGYAHMSKIHPNIYKGKKVAGILTEAETNFETGRISKITVGIGVNCYPVDFTGELAETATYLEGADRDFTREDLAIEIFELFCEAFSAKDKLPYMNEYRDKSMLIGEPIMVFNSSISEKMGRTGKTVQGIRAKAIGIDDEGGLIVEFMEGHYARQTTTLKSGEVTVRKHY